MKIDYFCRNIIFFMQVDSSKIDPKKNIIIKGAEVHNLKSVDVVIPETNWL
jgi:excinuclease ABC subunit A